RTDEKKYRGHDRQDRKMGCNVDKTRSPGHDCPRAIHEMCEREELGHLLDNGVCSFERKPDTRKQHHGPSEKVQDAARKFLARQSRRYKQAERDHADCAKGRYEKQVYVRAAHLEMDEVIAANIHGRGNSLDKDQAGRHLREQKFKGSERSGLQTL